MRKKNNLKRKEWQNAVLISVYAIISIHSELLKECPLLVISILGMAMIFEQWEMFRIICCLIVLQHADCRVLDFKPISPLVFEVLDVLLKCHSQGLFNRLSSHPQNHCSWGSSMSHEGCLYPCHGPPSPHICIYLSCGSMPKPPVNRSRVPLSFWILFICHGIIFLKGLQEGSYNEWSSHFPHSFFQTCQRNCLFQKNGAGWKMLSWNGGVTVSDRFPWWCVLFAF